MAKVRRIWNRFITSLERTAQVKAAQRLAQMGYFEEAREVMRRQ